MFAYYYTQIIFHFIKWKIKYVELILLLFIINNNKIYCKIFSKTFNYFNYLKTLDVLIINILKLNSIYFYLEMLIIYY